MPYTFIILKRETSRSLTKLPATPTAFAGFLLKVTVDIYNNISPKIFVMQRDVDSAYVDGVLDTFYSIVSVGELDLIPEDEPEVGGTQFFRTDSIELMFESVEDLEAGWKKIKFDVAALSKANDDSLTVDATSYSAFPVGAIPRYYGKHEQILTTGSEVTQSLFANDEYSSVALFNAAISTDSYLYFVLHSTFGVDHVISFKDIEQPTTVTAITISVGGSTQNYNIFRTTDPIQASDLGTASIA